jgi:predicted O-methyltransferase YrrM
LTIKEPDLPTPRRIVYWLSHPSLILERITEKRMNAAALHFYQQRTQAQNDTERAAFFAPSGDIAELVAEARSIPTYQKLVGLPEATDAVSQIAATQTTSNDDCVTMYVLVRLWQPHVMVETGVFYGAMSAMILQAMQRNGFGQLYSIDLPFESDGLPVDARGSLVPDELRPNWTLILGDSRVELPRLLARLGKIDAFNHDSLHSTQHMTWEFETAWPQIKPGGFLSSHDVLTTPSWRRFGNRHRAEIQTSGRVYGLGIARKRS